MLTARSLSPSYLSIQSVAPPYLHVCPGPEHRVTSPSLPQPPKEQSLAAVDPAKRRGRSSKQKRRSRSSKGREKEKGEGTRRRRRYSEGKEGGLGIQSPDSELEEEEGRQGERSQVARDRTRSKRGSQSLPRDALRNHDDNDTHRGTARGRKRERGRSTSRGRKSRSEEKGRKRERGRSASRGRKSRSEERGRKAESDEPAQEEEQEEEIVEEKVEEEVEEIGENVELEREDREEHVVLPIPNPNQKLPKPKQNWEEEDGENWEMGGKLRELQRVREPEGDRVRGERGWDGDSDDKRERESEQLNERQIEEDAQSEWAERTLPGRVVIDPVSQRKPFSFLTSTLSVEQLGDAESESGGSHSDSSASAASISGLSLAATETDERRGAVLPGPWLTPKQQRVAQVIEENRLPGRGAGQGGGRRAVS